MLPHTNTSHKHVAAQNLTAAEASRKPTPRMKQSHLETAGGAPQEAQTAESIKAAAAGHTLLCHSAAVSHSLTQLMQSVGMDLRSGTHFLVLPSWLLCQSPPLSPRLEGTGNAVLMLHVCAHCTLGAAHSTQEMTT